MSQASPATDVHFSATLDAASVTAGLPLHRDGGLAGIAAATVSAPRLAAWFMAAVDDCPAAKCLLVTTQGAVLAASMFPDGPPAGAALLSLYRVSSRCFGSWH